MAVREGKTRVAVTLPNYVAELLRENAKWLGFSTSKYVELLARANGTGRDERDAQIAVYELALAQEKAAYGRDEARKLEELQALKLGETIV